MADEMIDIYNESNEPTGVRKMKSEAHRDGSWHRAAHIWIYNSQGEVLLQHRAAGKPLYPDVWDVSVGGHVDAGEEPLEAAVRELAEELGLQADPEELEFFRVIKNSPPFLGFKNNEFYYVYFLKFDGSIDDLKLQREEVQAVAFFTIDEIKRRLSLNEEGFVPHGGYWFEALNEAGNRKLNIKP
jgi:isopentenyl-diphosphate delta-isomerase type 1